MQLALLFVLVFGVANTLSTLVPEESASSSVEEVEPVAKRIRFRGPDYLAMFASFPKSNKGYHDYIKALAIAHPQAPITTSLRKPTSAERADLREMYYVTLPEVIRLGYIKQGMGFLGKTPKGRFVFKVPHIQGVTLNIPDPHHAHSELLIAINNQIHHYGWSYIPGYSPETFRDIAIHFGDNSFLVKNNVPINRWAITRFDPEQSAWFKNLAQGNPIPGKGLKKLAEPYFVHLER